MKSRAIRLLCITSVSLFLLSSCFTSMVNTRMNSVYANGGESAALSLAQQNINGQFPDRILIKTPTQTFNQDYYFLISDGRIHYKSIDSSGSVPEWTRMPRNGLPSARLKRGFIKPLKIVAITADANELQALSDKGRIYEYTCDSGMIAKEYYWKDRVGWPEASPLELNDLVRGFRSWAASKRTEAVLWYEDRYGNQHHYGIKGLETSYFLCADGQEIRYTDPGLPSDFSHTILGPERGAFIAENLSASASTMFVINAAGEMYTRLADFDTLGCDFLFQYTYHRITTGIPGSNYRSGYTPWALPAEDWKKQPPIEVRGKARLTKCITIIQNGQGNAARELRVAGTDDQGRTGYYSKEIDDAEWCFIEAALILQPKYFLESRAVASAKAPRGPSADTAYRGMLWQKNVPLSDITLEIPDFSLNEGSCHLAVLRKGERAEILLHPVDAWTYVRRYNPGRDKTPKLMMVTIEIPENAFASVSGEFRSILTDLFSPYDRATFTLTAEATTEYLLIRQSVTFKNDIALFLSTDPGAMQMNPDIFRRVNIGNDDLIDEFSSSRLELPEKEIEDHMDSETLAGYIERNVEFRAALKNSIRMYRSYRISSSISGKTFSFFNTLSHVTLLYLIDYPKLYTATRQGSVIMKGNRNNIDLMTDAKYWMYRKILELLDIRIQVYREVLDSREKKLPPPANLAAYSETFLGYYDLTGIPRNVAGVWHPETSAIPCLSSAELLERDLPGILIIMRDPDPEIYLVDFDSLPNDIFNHGSLDFAKNPLTTPVTVSSLITPGIASAASIAGEESSRSGGGNSEISATLKWDGEELTIYFDDREKGRTILFKSRRS